LSVAAQVAVAEVVGEDENDVRSALALGAQTLQLRRQCALARKNAREKRQADRHADTEIHAGQVTEGGGATANKINRPPIRDHGRKRFNHKERREHKEETLEPCFRPHSGLEPAKVFQVSGTADVLADSLKTLRRGPTPMLDMSVGESEVATLIDDPLTRERPET
jgi:hypothetical protein